MSPEEKARRGAARRAIGAVRYYEAGLRLRAAFVLARDKRAEGTPERAVWDAHIARLDARLEKDRPK